MTTAKPDHRHHCSCPKLAPDLHERILTAYSQYGEAFCSELHRVITGVRDPAALHPSPHASGRARILAKITPPDASGHQHYLGVWPRWGAPRAAHAGSTHDIVQWLWLWSEEGRFVEWRNGEHLVRMCHDVHCVSPDHHRLPSTPADPAELMTAGLYAWERDHPRPLDPRSTKWLTGELTGWQGERCLAGHLIKVYSVRPRKSYCAQCSAIMRAWQSARKAEQSRLDRMLLDNPRPQPNEPLYADPASAPSPDEPSLVAQLLAMGAWDTPVS